MSIESVFDIFCSEIVRRTNILTEDNIRYYWFTCMLRQDKLLNNYTLEQPYSQYPLEIGSLANKELDLLYCNRDECFCLEMKFHRKSTPSTFPHTSAAGELFDDLQRLQQIPSQIDGIKMHRLLLYVNDNEMHNYFRSNRLKDDKYSKLLKKFYAQEPSTMDLDFTKAPNAPKSFLKSANDSFVDKTGLFKISNLKLLRTNDLSSKSALLNNGQLHIRLYEI